MRRPTLLARFARFTCLGGGLALAALQLLGGCGKDPGPLTWKELQPVYFSALNLKDEAAQQGLPDYEQRLEAVAKELLQKLDAGELTDETERTDAGLTLFYQGFLLNAGQQALEDGQLKPKEFLRPQRYAAGGNDRTEQVARLVRSAELLRHAAELRPDDARLATLTLGGRYNRESLEETPQHSPVLLFDMLDAARADSYSLFATLVSWRDPVANPGDADHMNKLLTTVCAPEHLDCSRPPAAPPRPLDGKRQLTQEVAGPVLMNDLLVRRAEALLKKADEPATLDKQPLLNEALARLQFARGALGFVSTNVMDPALSHYPARDQLPARADRIELLLAATQARLAGMADPPPLPDADYYTSRTYRAAYACVACHTKGTATEGLPK
ncbi:MAG TPA: hypothetical protein PLW65_24560 [Pseudomonadota bacterium]|nr:hypothetical protein [Pseudomonadota bacterium]